MTPQGRPYLEAHHVRRVSDGGPDHPLWPSGKLDKSAKHQSNGQHGDRRRQALSPSFEGTAIPESWER